MSRIRRHGIRQIGIRQNGAEPSVHTHIYRVVQKTDPLVYFDDNFGKYGPILTIFSLIQQEIYEAQKLSYFSHLTFIMLPLYLAKQTLMLVSMQIFWIIVQTLNITALVLCGRYVCNCNVIIVERSPIARQHWKSLLHFLYRFPASMESTTFCCRKWTTLNFTETSTRRQGCARDLFGRDRDVWNCVRDETETETLQVVETLPRRSVTRSPAVSRMADRNAQA